MKHRKNIKERAKRCKKKNKRLSTKRRRKSCRRHRSRLKRTLFEGRRFFSLEAFIRFLHKFIGGLLEKKLGKKAPQAAFSWTGCLFALLLRALLGFAHLSRLIEELQQNKALSRALGLRRAFKNSKPLTELLLKFSWKIAHWLYVQVLVQMRAHGLIFGKTVSIDTCYLHVYGKTYQKAERGYSSQLKQKIRGYKLWVAFSIESKLPISFHLDSGNKSDLTHFRKVFGQATYIMGKDRIRYVLAVRGFCDRKLYYWLDKVMKVKFVFRAKAGQSSAYIQNSLDALEPSDYGRLNRHCRVAHTTVHGFNDSLYALRTYRDRRYKNPLHLITNDFSLQAGQLKNLYLKRWTVETYFAQGKEALTLGKFSCTKFRGVCGEVTLSLLAKVLERAFVLLMGRRYRRLGSTALQQRVWMHGFVCPKEDLERPGMARKNPLIAALQRDFSILERWKFLTPKERFAHCRPALFEKSVFDLPNISIVPNSSAVMKANCITKTSVGSGSCKKPQT